MFSRIFAIAVFFFLLMFPYIWESKEVALNISDNLDSNLVWYKILKDQQKLFAAPWENVEGFVTATPRFSYPSGLNVVALLYYSFAIFDAYWINKLLISFIAFLGMMLLFSDFDNRNNGQVIGIGLLWASLAYNPHIGISIAGLPLLYWSFSNFRMGKFLYLSMFSVVFYCFYSNFVLVGVFVLVFILFCLIYWRLQDGKTTKLGVGAVILMVFCYGVQEYNLFYFIFLQNDFISHRTEMDYLFNGFSNNSPWHFIKNGDHNGAFYWWGYVLLGAGAVSALLFKLDTKVLSNNFSPYEKNTFFVALVFFIALPVLTSVFSWAPLINQFGKIFPRFHSFNLLRIGFLFPFFLFLILGLGLMHVRFWYKTVLIGFLLAVNIFVYQFEWRHIINNRYGFLDYQVPTYAQFFAVQQFDDVKEYLGVEWKNINIGSVNIPPAVGVFNGFNGVDGYLPLYSLHYKTKFRKVIEGELAKDQELFQHYQYWGNKCYLQNATHPDLFNAYKWADFEPIHQLDFDFDLLKNEFNCYYLISAVEINVDRMEFLKLFSHKDSAWDIYLYKIN